jgi:hypothetical protein
MVMGFLNNGSAYFLPGSETGWGCNGRGECRWVQFKNGSYVPLGYQTLQDFRNAQSNQTNSSHASQTKARQIAEGKKKINENYDKCVEKHGARIPKEAAKDIYAVHIMEGVPLTLMSVTWRHESKFSYDVGPKPRKENGKIVGYDVGPMQVSTNYFARPPFTTGLPNAFTKKVDINLSKFIKREIADKESDLRNNQWLIDVLGTEATFQGDWFENLRLAARAFTMDIIPRSRGGTTLLQYADAAGIYRGKDGYTDRYNQYKTEAPLDEKFFNCLLGIEEK